VCGRGGTALPQQNSNRDSSRARTNLGACRGCGRGCGLLGLCTDRLLSRHHVAGVFGGKLLELAQRLLLGVDGGLRRAREDAAPLHTLMQARRRRCCCCYAGMGLGDTFTGQHL